MKEVYYTYNNEAIGSCIILSFLDKVGEIDIARSCLILPFLLDDRSVKYLNSNIVDDTIESIVKNHPNLFTSFNNRFLSLLPVTLNALSILSKTGQIDVKNTISIKGQFSIENVDMGNRYNRIEKIIPIFIQLLANHSTSQLYKILNIQL